MPVYCEGVECKGDLAKRLQRYRSDRPSEWAMDEFIYHAEELESERNQLRADLKEMTDKNWRVARDLAKSRVELEKERERVKFLRSALKLASSRLTSMHTTIEEDALIRRALSAGEGGSE